ncbi:glycosyltransferase family 2 protein [Novipirellula artificiosorum]|uniref:Putative glycosyl transferase n=1 Tax=Novipirellula artificiosorum TaxID=2528016 RepID=A0A5C6D066_9BACT|nr:glycosyltransferase family 2 protein [Novipirellula artificiosorum]TWU29141.1 putative glycosyl transferase [Novipirellula artificiosorum]
MFDGDTTNGVRSVTIVLINHNGGEWLRSCLSSFRKSFENSELYDWAVDLLVVDNASSDNSIEIIRSELLNAKLKWKLICESEAGVNFARNRGLRNSNSEYIIFVDSDIVFAEGWISGYLRAFDARPSCCIFAGRILVGKIESRLPAWLDLDGTYSRPSIVVRCDLGATDLLVPFVDIQRGGGPAGPNMAFRSQIFQELGEFDTSFGLRPGSLVPGAEAEFFDRVKRKEHVFCYVADACVWHPLKKDQISKKYFIHRLEGTGRVLSRIQHKEGLVAKRIFGVKRYLFRQIVLEIIRYVGFALTGSARQRFYGRCQISIVAGMIKEDYTLARSAPLIDMDDQRGNLQAK